MTREEAIKGLKVLRKDFSGYKPNEEMFDMAIEALEQDRPKWIPVSERLPEENEPVLVGIRYKDDFKMVVTARMDVTYWQGLGRDIKGEMRWMPLPEAYKESDADGSD